MTKEKLSPCDEMLHIMNTIWSSRTPEQLKGCYKMFETYKNKYDNSNIGIVLIEIELSRQQRLNGLFKKMGLVEQALKDQNKETVNTLNIVKK